MKKNCVNKIKEIKEKNGADITNLSNEDDENDEYFECRVDILNSSERNVFLIYQDQKGSIDPLPVHIYHFVDKRSITP